jgi:hypothetical protein
MQKRVQFFLASFRNGAHAVSSERGQTSHWRSGRSNCVWIVSFLGADRRGARLCVWEGSIVVLLFGIIGLMFSLEKSNDGQLGLGDCGASVSNPRVVSDLLGNKIVRVAGGRKHSLFLDSQNRVWSAGASGVVTSNVPALVATNGVAVSDVFCGPFGSFLHVGGTYRESAGVFFLDEEKISRVEKMTEVANASVRHELNVLAETAFSFPGAVNGSFLDPSAYFATGNEETPGIETERALRFIDKLVSLGV